MTPTAFLGLACLPKLFAALSEMAFALALESPAGVDEEVGD